VPEGGAKDTRGPVAARAPWVAATPTSRRAKQGCRPPWPDQWAHSDQGTSCPTLRRWSSATTGYLVVEKHLEAVPATPDPAVPTSLLGVRALGDFAGFAGLLDDQVVGVGLDHSFEL
jgi:hypothetical protein